MSWLRTVGPLVLAFAAAAGLDWVMAGRGLLPPGFGRPGEPLRPAELARRGVALVLVAGILWLGVFAPLGLIGLGQKVDFESLPTSQLFALHELLILVMVAWYLLGFAAVPPRAREAGAPQETVASGRTGPDWRREWVVQFGFRSLGLWRELGIGLVAGLGAWLCVIGILLAVGLSLVSLGGEGLLPQQPPAAIAFMAALPVGVRLALSLSAGFVEEAFFRGFLQPRVGIAISTLLFAMAHASYEQPFMLLGVTLLSLIYGFLVRWRQNIWPAIAAHALFDAVQLLVVIPSALDLLPKDGGEALAPLAALIGG